MNRCYQNPYSNFVLAEASADEKWVRDLIFEYVTPIIELDLNSYYGDKRANLYSGTAGIAYMFLKLHQSKIDFGPLNPLKNAKRFIKHAKANKLDLSESSAERDEICSFLRGYAGIYCVSAKISSISHDMDELSKDLAAFQSGYETCKQMEFIDYGCDELFVGRAGYLSGIYWLNRQIVPKPFEDDQILEMCQVVIESGRKHSKKKGSKFPIVFEYHNTNYLGALHGLVSILHMLLESPWFQINSDRRYQWPNIPHRNLEYIKRSIDVYLEHQDDAGNFPSATEDFGQPNAEHEVNWYNGAPGAVYLLLKAHLVFREPKYLNACRKITDLVWQYGLLKKGPGLSCGVAGNGYVFLIMYRLTGELKYLYRATKFAQFLKDPEFVNNIERTDCPYSLYEGVAGTVCFLVDLLDPMKSCFPFMDVI